MIYFNVVFVIRRNGKKIREGIKRKIREGIKRKIRIGRGGGGIRSYSVTVFTRRITPIIYQFLDLYVVKESLREAAKKSFY